MIRGATVRSRRGYGAMTVGAGAQKPAFSRKPGSLEATGLLAKSLWPAGGCPLRPKSAMESHWGLAESCRVHEPISTSQFAAVAAPLSVSCVLMNSVRRLANLGVPRAPSAIRRPGILEKPIPPFREGVCLFTVFRPVSWEAIASKMTANSEIARIGACNQRVESIYIGVTVRVVTLVAQKQASVTRTPRNIPE